MMRALLALLMLLPHAALALSTLTGGGAVIVSVLCNGTVWIVQ
jgi:hypothetical protein